MSIKIEQSVVDNGIKVTLSCEVRKSHQDEEDMQKTSDWLEESAERAKMFFLGESPGMPENRPLTDLDEDRKSFIREQVEGWSERIIAAGKVKENDGFSVSEVCRRVLGMHREQGTETEHKYVVTVLKSLGWFSYAHPDTPTKYFPPLICGVVIFGPQGCGKSTHAEALARVYGCSEIWDDGAWVPFTHLPEGVLALTSVPDVVPGAIYFYDAIKLLPAGEAHQNG